MSQALPDPARVDPVDAGGARLGGRIRTVPEDFVVEEIPLYRPMGRGEHVLFEIEKAGMSTFDVLLRVSKGAKVSEHNVSYAGLKDTRAVTRQYLSVPRVPPERLLAIRHPRFRVLSAARHVAALKIGHHRGNRFRIRIRDVDATRIPAARTALETLAQRGLPNAYGAQRFGVRQDGHLLGRAIVAEDWKAFLDHLLGLPSPLEANPKVVAARDAYDRGDLEACLALFPLKHRPEKKALSCLLRTGSPREAFEALGKRPRRIWVAAWQSYLFNRILARRVEEGTYDRLLPGDIAALEDSGACFPVETEAAAAEATAAGARPTGLLAGHDPPAARGLPGEIEREVLEEAGVEPEAFRAAHVRTRGTRRSLCVPVREAGLVDLGDASVEIRFVLPPGSFATVLLERLIGAPVA